MKATTTLMMAAAAVAVAVAGAAARPQHVVMPLQKSVHHTAARYVSDAALRDDPVDGDVWPVAIFWTFVEIGTPPQPFPVAIDTGSATLDVPAYQCNGCVTTKPNNAYNPANSSTSAPLACDGSCQCQDGQCVYSNTYQTCDLSNPSAPCTISGAVYTDQVSIGGATKPAKMVVETISYQTSNFDQFKVIDGVMGVAGGDTLITALYAEGAIPEEVFSMCFVEGTTSNGTLTVGGLDDRLYNGTILYTDNAGAEYGFYGLQLNNNGISVGGKVVAGTAEQSLILDSGTNVLLLEDSMFQSFRAILTAGCNDGTAPPGVCGDNSLFDGVCMPLTDAQMAQFPDITIGVPGSQGKPDFELVMTPRNYLLLGEKKTGRCLGVRNTGPGGNFIMGDTTMESYLTVFDVAEGTIGFAPVNRENCGSI